MPQPINRAFVCKQLNAEYHAIFLADERVFLARVRRIHDGAILGEARHDVEEEAVNAAFEQARSGANIPHGPVSPEQSLKQQIETLQQQVAALTEKLEQRAAAPVAAIVPVTEIEPTTPAPAPSPSSPTVDTLPPGPPLEAGIPAGMHGVSASVDISDADETPARVANEPTGRRGGGSRVRNTG